jgi:hypothetical protein
MQEQMITLPRAVVAALVDPGPNRMYYISPARRCYYCGTRYEDRLAAAVDHIDHDIDCPVRLAQEALKEQS